eukprot:7199529-Pyramimonas_sp.AAC.1
MIPGRRVGPRAAAEGCGLSVRQLKAADCRGLSVSGRERSGEVRGRGIFERVNEQGNLVQVAEVDSRGGEEGRRGAMGTFPNDPGGDRAVTGVPEG